MTGLASRADALLAGNLRFAASSPELCRDVASRRAESAARHAPAAAVLACADARVAPELVFDQPVGELFSVRVAGNVAARAAVASLDYAVDQLAVDLVVVLGHERCGAVTAAVAHVDDGVPVAEELRAVVDPILPAVESTAGLPGDHVHHAVVANVAATVERLRQEPGPLGRRVRAGEVELVGGVYDLETGRVRLLGTVPDPSTVPTGVTAGPDPHNNNTTTTTTGDTPQ